MARLKLRRTSGMTLTELMVSMTVLAVVIGWVLVAYTNQQRTQLDHERVIEAQHEGRLVTDLIVSDLRMAGFLIPTFAGVASVDGGNAASDMICMSDPAIFDPAEVANANGRFAGARATAGVNANAGTVDVGAGDLDIDSNGVDDFAIGSGVIIADGNSAHCARVTALGASTITFAPNTPAGFSANAAEAVVVPAVLYEVVGTDLQRNGTALSSSVEDIQVEYWVDANGDSDMADLAVDDAGEFPVNDLEGQDLGELRLARVSVTSRSERGDSELAGNAFTAVANRAAGPADNFKRRRQIAETLLRNLR